MDFVFGERCSKQTPWSTWYEEDSSDGGQEDGKTSSTIFTCLHHCQTDISVRFFLGNTWCVLWGRRDIGCWDTDTHPTHVQCMPARCQALGCASLSSRQSCKPCFCETKNTDKIKITSSHAVAIQHLEQKVVQRVLCTLCVTCKTILTSTHPHVTFIYSPRINSFL